MPGMVEVRFGGGPESCFFALLSKLDFGIAGAGKQEIQWGPAGPLDCVFGGLAALPFIAAI